IASFLLISILLGTLTAYAYHEGDFTALNKGHYKWGQNAGLLQYTENITISRSKSTSCDMTLRTYGSNTMRFRNK
ncbi:MAG: hypothetical protein VXW44_05875, partial [SAR324 cluster bacterium]|nr:hypothetical protein [SAR324 cluster bacterium]